LGTFRNLLHRQRGLALVLLAGLELAERYFGTLPGGARALAPWAPASA